MKTKPPQTLNRDWLTVQQAADYLQLDAQTVRKYVRLGRLEGRQIVAAGKWRISAASIEKLLRG